MHQWGMLDLECCCRQKPSNGYYLVRDYKGFKRELDLVVQQWAKVVGYLLGGTISRFLLFLHPRHSLMYILRPVFWSEIESLRLLPVPSPPFLTHNSGCCLGMMIIISTGSAIGSFVVCRSGVGCVCLDCLS